MYTIGLPTDMYTIGCATQKVKNKTLNQTYGRIRIKDWSRGFPKQWPFPREKHYLGDDSMIGSKPISNEGVS